MGSGAGDQSRVAADQAEAQARMNRLQGQMTRGNITLMSDALTTSLDRYDHAAGQTLGSTALQLARTGNLSRKRSGYSTAADLGIENLASSNPVDAIQKEYGQLIEAANIQDRLDQARAEMAALGDYHQATYTYNDGQTTGTYAGPPPAPGEEPEGYGAAYTEYSDAELQRKKELQEKISDLNEQLKNSGADLDEFNKLGGETTYRLNPQVKEYISLLEESMDLINKTTDKINTEANESIDRQIAGTYTVGSTHTQMSKMLQQVMMQRDDILNNGLNQMFTTAQQAVMLDKSAAEADKMAADYRDLAMDQDYNAMLQTVLSGTFMAAGAVAGGVMGGVGGAGLGMSAGQAGGSFLGSAFARR